ncbi:MAG: NosD domain-containing protein [bacterium]
MSLGNGRGIWVWEGAQHNQIGPGNVISGNLGYGIQIQSEGTDSNTVVGNIIGLDPSGTLARGNENDGVVIYNEASRNVIGGILPALRNIISGNGRHGIRVSSLAGDSNRIVGNFIGTDISGTFSVPNQGNGIVLSSGAKANIIGGVEEGAGNLISGNKESGIWFYNEDTEGNQVIGNLIGTDVTGELPLKNNEDGIFIGYGSKNNQIGGSGEFDGNIISGNGRMGIYISGEGTEYNRIQGNYIGLNASGDDTIPNYIGIEISSNHNRIGGRANTEGNIISGNKSYGIHLTYADSNEVFGNIIGTTIAFDSLGSNGSSGISLYDCSGNIIGGEDQKYRNIIVNSGYQGIELSGSDTKYNAISGNYIGTDPNEEKSLPNDPEGIYIGYGASYNTIGPANVIAYNLHEGIVVQDSASVGNTITMNSIYNNRDMGISLLFNANQKIQKPIIQVGENVSGTAPPLSTVEIFSGPDEEGKDFESSVTANDAGTFIWEGTPAGSWVTATATDTAGNTSEFSSAWLMGGIVVTTTTDTGEGSLRWAINQSNLTRQADTIWFNISQDDDNFDGTVWRIAPQTELPELSGGGTVIYGLSQKDNQSDTNPQGPEIFLDGSEITGYSDGLEISSSHNAVCGLVISGFVWLGLRIEGDEAVNNQVYANYIARLEMTLSRMMRESIFYGEQVEIE